MIFVGATTPQGSLHEDHVRQDRRDERPLHASCGSRIETDLGITGLGECVHGGHQAIAIIHDLRRGWSAAIPSPSMRCSKSIRRGLVFEGGFAGALIIGA